MKKVVAAVLIVTLLIAERPNCAGCIFNEDIYEYTCMLKGMPGDWKI